MRQFRRWPFFIQLPVAGVLLLIAVLAAVRYGAADTSWQDIFALFSNGGGEYDSVLREIRIPRVIAAVFVGCALAAAGAIMQGVTRNPLADPGLLGLTSGANAALALAMALMPATSYLILVVACFIGAGFGMFLVLAIGASMKDGFSPLKLVLAGAAVTAFLQAVAEGTGLIFDISKDISLWTSGGLIGTTWQALLTVPVITAGLLLALLCSRQLTVLSMHEETAVGLGLRTAWIKSLLMAVVVLLAGSAVALAGNLAFVGLMIPHIARSLVGSDYRYIVPMSIVLGGLFMVSADLAGRLLNAPFETPVMAIVSVIGLPFFLFFVRKGGRAFAP